MRTTYLVCYDVADAKRLRKVFKTCGNFGEHLQFSVFECDLNPSEKVELETELGEIINHDEDQVIFCRTWTGRGTRGPGDHRHRSAIYEIGRPLLRGVISPGSLTTEVASGVVMWNTPSALAWCNSLKMN